MPGLVEGRLWLLAFVRARYSFMAVINTSRKVYAPLTYMSIATVRT